MNFFLKALFRITFKSAQKFILAVVSTHDISNLKCSGMIFREDSIDSMQIQLISSKRVHR